MLPLKAPAAFVASLPVVIVTAGFTPGDAPVLVIITFSPGKRPSTETLIAV